MLIDVWVRPGHLKMAFFSAQCCLDGVFLSGRHFPCRIALGVRSALRNPICRCPPLRCPPLGPPEERRVVRERSPRGGADNPQAAATHQSSSRSLHSIEANERSKHLRGPLMTQGKSPEGNDTKHAKKSVNNRAKRAGTSKLGRHSLMSTHNPEARAILFSRFDLVLKIRSYFRALQGSANIRSDLKIRSLEPQGDWKTMSKE